MQRQVAKQEKVLTRRKPLVFIQSLLCHGHSRVWCAWAHFSRCEECPHGKLHDPHIDWSALTLWQMQVHRVSPLQHPRQRQRTPGKLAFCFVAGLKSQETMEGKISPRRLPEGSASRAPAASATSVLTASTS